MLYNKQGEAKQATKTFVYQNEVSDPSISDNSTRVLIVPRNTTQPTTSRDTVTYIIRNGANSPLQSHRKPQSRSCSTLSFATDSFSFDHSSQDPSCTFRDLPTTIENRPEGSLIPTEQVYSTLSRGNVPQILSYRPFSYNEGKGKTRIPFNKSVLSESSSDLRATIHHLPSTSIVSSLDLSHQYFDVGSSSGNIRRGLPLSLENEPVSLDPLYPQTSAHIFNRSSQLLRNVKVIKADNSKRYVKKHRRIVSSISISSETDKRAKTLGFKSSKKGLRPFGFEDDVLQHSIDMHHFSYNAPAKNIILRYCPKSLQRQFVAMRTFNRSNNLRTQTPGSKDMLNETDGRIGIKGRSILKDVSFRARSGEISGILGGSGSGKTTLLDAIACRLDNRGYNTGKVLIDGLRSTPSTVKRKLAYVIQHDRLLPNLTVKETLSFVARLTYPEHSWAILDEKVTEVLDELGLMHVKSSRVGDELERGISGGEKRRLSIACQLIKFTHILILDEPTTGLDSFNAYNLIETLSRLSRKNIVVIATIHQPGSELFPFFDTITLMSNGHIVYHGRRASLIPYFTSIGYPCPDYQNPLDHYIDVVSIDRYTKLNQELTETKLKTLLQHYRRSALYTDLISELGSRNYLEVRWKYQCSPILVLYKMALLVHRMNINVVRSIRAFGMRSTVGLMFALMLFAFMLRLSNDQAGMQNRIGLLFQIVNGPTFFGIMNAVDLFPTLRDLFYRESLDGLYQPWQFILAYFVHVFPFTIVTSLLFGFVGYWGIGFYPDPVRFVYFIVIFFILMIQGESITVMILGVISDPVLANGLVSLIMSMSITIGTGLIRNFQTQHPIFELLSYGSMHRYATSCLAANEFGGLNLTCGENEYCAYTKGEEYLQLFYPDAIENKNTNFTILYGYLVILLVLCHGLYSLMRIPRLR